MRLQSVFPPVGVPSPNADPATIFAGATFASISNSLMNAPIDRIVTIWQTQHVNPQLTPSTRYKGYWDTIKRVYKEQGFKSYWRGASAAVSMNLVAGTSANLTRDFLKKMRPSDVAVGSPEFIAMSVACGMVTGAVASLVAYPLELAYVKMAADVGSVSSAGPDTTNRVTRRYHGLADVFKSTVAAEGITGLYRGLLVSLGAVVAYRAIYYGLYDSTKHLVIDVTDKSTKSAANQFAFAYLIATVTGALTLPFQVVRKRLMMMVDLPLEQRRYNGAISCISHMIRTEGIRSLWRGQLVNLFRSPGSVLLLAGYDTYLWPEFFAPRNKI